MFVRDGRSFDAVANTTARTVRPWPSTVAGATREAFGGDVDAEPDAVRGPVLARKSAAGDTWRLYFQVPADLVATVEQTAPYVFRLSSVDPFGATDLGDGVRRRLQPPPQAGNGKVEPVPGWLPGDVLAAYLAGGHPPADGMPKADLRLEDPERGELRVGLARAGRQAKTGYLYQATHLRIEEHWSLLAEYEPRAGWDRVARGPVPLGGRGRLADVTALSGPDWPASPGRFPGGRVLVYLATPAIWPGGWRIPIPPGGELWAAVTGEPVPVATTSPREGWQKHRMLRWAVPAGSVYLLKFGAEDLAAEWAGSVHGKAFGPVDDRLCTAGFGVVLTGVWT
ncbi:MAG TPA: type III-B CRISPR module-associated Cmr3 family protein [Streptosporangiaceae bacterium]